MRYFDYEQVAREAKIPADELAELYRLARQEFPWDEMLYELHLLRACLAIRDGHVTVEEMLSPARRNYVAGSAAEILPCQTLGAARHSGESRNPGAEEWIPGRGLRPCPE